MSHIPVTNAAPAVNDMAVPVRPIGAGAGGATPVVEPVYTAAGTVVAYSAVDVALLAANANRYGFSIMNLTDRVLYIKLGGVAAAADCTAAIQPNQLYESQKRTTVTVHGIGAAGGAGNWMITEYTI